MIGEYFEEAFVEADGFRIRYVAGGSGHPIIHLHGGGGLQLSPAYELLAQTFRVIAFEMPGFGTPPENGRSASIEDLARSMNAAVAALGIERYSLMGSSFGSTLALWMAILRPESVEAIVLNAPATLRASPDESFVKRAADLSLPVLALFGTVDTISPPEDAHLYRNLLQNCHIMLVYGAGHAIDDDRPEAFASLAGDFLTRKEQFVVRETSALIHP
jgi:pimeloyl-ACP methyl ester carboxylesterase